MTGFTIFIYTIALIAFLVVSAMIFRHAIKYSYLSPRFKKIVMIFGSLSGIIIIFSVYLVISLLFSDPSSSMKNSSSSNNTNTSNTSNTSSNSSDINF